MRYSPLPMGVYAASGQCVMANDAYAQVMGATQEALLKQNFNDVISWQKSGLLDDCRTALEEQSSQRREIHLVNSFSKEIWLACRVVPIHLKNEKHLLIKFFDLTERKRDEVALQKSEERLAMALEASLLSTWDFDISTGMIHLDDQWASIVGDSSDAKITTPGKLAQLTHPDDLEMVSNAALKTFKGINDNFNKEFRVKMVSGDWKWIKCSGKVVERGANNRATRAIGTNLDITERKTAEEKIRQLAYYDNVTNLPNRRLLLDRLDQALAQSKRFERSLAIMFLDLDRFKNINDTLGHDVGDEVLKVVAERLVRCIRSGDTVSRQGGDEFVIVLAEIRDPSDAPCVAEKILKSMERPIYIAGQELSVTASIGVSIYPIDGADDMRDLMKKADIAMYAAKKSGRNRVHFFKIDDLTVEVILHAY
ncbi:MAG: diguanylate cyclase [Herbaspirillum sp.]